MKNKTETIEIRVTPEEKALYKKKANECGLQLSAYIRMLANGHKPVPVPSAPYLDCARVLSDLHNLYRERNDPEAADKILRLVKLMTESLSPVKQSSYGDH